METHIQKWGNSLGVRIPIYLAKQLQLQPGSLVNINIEEGRLIIESQKYDLNMMLKEITPQNLHHLELEDNEQMGNEVW
jgi:antitoxin MazE